MSCTGVDVTVYMSSIPIASYGNYRYLSIRGIFTYSTLYTRDVLFTPITNNDRCIMEVHRSNLFHYKLFPSVDIYNDVTRAFWIVKSLLCFYRRRRRRTRCSFYTALKNYARNTTAPYTLVIWFSSCINQYGIFLRRSLRTNDTGRSTNIVSCFSKRRILGRYGFAPITIVGSIVNGRVVRTRGPGEGEDARTEEKR